MGKFDGYSLEQVKEIVKIYGNRTDFHKKNYRLYRYCKEKGWLDEIYSEIPRKKKWTIEELMTEALKYKTRGEFMKQNISAYNTALKSDKYDEIVSHMGEKVMFCPKRKWTYERLKDIYDEFTTLSDLRKKYGQNVVTVAKNNGWFDELSKHFQKTERSNMVWTFEKVQEDAKKYNSRKEFGVNCPSAYQKAIAMEWLDKISSHMENGYVKWTKEKIENTISDCKTIKDLKKKSTALYAYIKRHNLEREFFKS